MDLDRRVGHPGQHLRGIEFGRGNLSVRRQALVQPVSSGEGQKIRRIDLGHHIGKLERNSLKFADLLAELFPLGRIA